MSKLTEIDLGLCMPSLPCQHDVKLKYDDGSECHKRLTAWFLIEDQYWSSLKTNQKVHFVYMVNHAQPHNLKHSHFLKEVAKLKTIQ